jgi:hypothetical protein
MSPSPQVRRWYLPGPTADAPADACRRHTRTKPLRDVDIVIVLRDTSYLGMHHREIFQAVRKVPGGHYGAAEVCTGWHASRVAFGAKLPSPARSASANPNRRRA